MSPWGRFILEHIGIDGRGLFFGWRVIEGAESIWGTDPVSHWCSSVFRHDEYIGDNL